MRRKLLTLCSVVSLLLCGAVCGLWARGYIVGDLVWGMREVLTADHYYVGWVYIESGAGTFGVRYTTLQDDGTAGRRLNYRPPAPWRAGREPSGPPIGARNRWHLNGAPVGNAPLWLWHCLGFVVRRDVYSTSYTPATGIHWATTSDAVNVVVPAWSAALATGLLPAVWITHRIRERRRRRIGCCRACGYDLRATPDRCPECGAVPATPVAAQHANAVERAGG